MNPTGSEAARVIVLGHSGFIGRTLMRRLTADPAYRVIGQSLPSVDLRDGASVKSLAPLFTPDTVVVMCAAIKRQAGDTYENFRQNMLMIFNLAQMIVERPIGRLILMSSAAVYGEDIDNRRITEESSPDIRSYYGLAKLSAEQILAKVTTDTGGTLVCLRPPTIYGPFEETPSYGVGSFFRQAAAEETITLWGDGTELRGMTFVDDVIEVIARLIPHRYAGPLNLTSSHSYSFREALDVVASLAGRPINIATRERSKKKVDNIFDNSRFMSVLPDFAFTDLATGARLTYEREYQNKA